MIPTTTLEHIVEQARQLPPDDQVKLIQRVAEMLMPTPRPRQTRPLVYGEFKGENMSTEEDFIIAEWHPTEKELDGALIRSRHSCPHVVS